MIQAFEFDERQQAQALLVCIWADTQNAALVRKQVIAAFMAYRRGQLVVAQPVQNRP